MARDPKRMALYEAIRKGQSKRQGRRKTVLFRPFGLGRARFGRRRQRDTSLSGRLNGVGSGYASRRRSPRLLKGLLPVSLRTVGLVAAALAMIVFGSMRLLESRGGRKWFLDEPKQEIEQPGGGTADGGLSIFPPPVGSQKVEITPVPNAAKASQPKAVDKPKEPVKAPTPQGTNVIVIQTYRQRRDLEPVQEHFAANGVETEIVERGSYFFLVTKQLYQRCSVDRTSFNAKYDGDVARQKIQNIGKTYKAPAGYETFRPKLFQDAYAEKVR